MKRNLFLLCSIILFWIFSYTIHNWILIIDDAYMSKKQDKIDFINQQYIKAKDSNLFSAMIADGKDQIIKIVTNNHSKFLEEASVDESKKVNDKLVNIINNEGLASTMELYDYQPIDDNSFFFICEFKLTCEYKDLIIFLSALEKHEKIFNVEKLEIRNPVSQDNMKVVIRLSEFRVG